MNTPVIVAPHADDEIIGCYEILKEKPIIVYTSNMDKIRNSELEKLNNFFELKGQYFNMTMNKRYRYYFPHPVYESHPDHRRDGMIGENMLRDGYDVTFYSTEMNAPFKYECKDFYGKKSLLEKVYPSQSSLWKYEHKFFLFSGYDKWVII